MSREAQDRAMNHANKLGAGAKKRKQLHSKKDKAAVVMREFYNGTLHSSDGKIVTNVAQAKAIAMSESGQARKSMTNIPMKHRLIMFLKSKGHIENQEAVTDINEEDMVPVELLDLGDPEKDGFKSSTGKKTNKKKKNPRTGAPDPDTNLFGADA